MASIGKSLHVLQQSLKMSARKMSKALGVPYDTYLCWIYEKRIPSSSARRLIMIVTDQLVEKWKNKRDKLAKAGNSRDVPYGRSRKVSKVSSYGTSDKSDKKTVEEESQNS